MIVKILINIILAVVLLLCVLIGIAPDKDKYGNYTNAIKYYTSESYYKNNF